MPALRHLLPLLLCAALLPPAAASAADHPPLGAYAQLTGSAGCLGLPGNGAGCAAAPGLGDSSRLAVTADGRHVYAMTQPADGGPTLVGLATDPVTGALRAAEPVVCLTGWPQDGCMRSEELWRPTIFAIAPDGRHLYLTVDDAFEGPTRITTWTRDPGSGALARVPGADGCVTSGPGDARCRHVAGLATGGVYSSGLSALAFSPDGTSLYALGSSTDRDAGRLVTLARDPAGGRLTQPSATGCLAEGAPLPAGCLAARALIGAAEVVVSSDGRNVYVSGGTQTAGTVAVFARGAQGGLSQPAGTAGCVRGGAAPGDCATGRAMNGAPYTGFPAPLAISPDGATVYKGASGGGGGIAVFARDRAAGTLAQLPGRDGCVVEGPATADCGGARGVSRVWGLEAAPEGDTLLAFDYGGQGGGGHVAVLGRGATGALTQLPAPYGCIGNIPEPACLETPLLRSTAGGAIAPDGGAVYVGGWDSDFSRGDPIVVLSREAAPICDADSVRAVGGVATELTLACREPNGQPLTRAIVEWPAHGTLRAADGDGRFLYTPDAGYAGADAIAFRASDGAHQSAVAQIAVEVRRPEREPDQRRAPEPEPGDRRTGEHPERPQLALRSRGLLAVDSRGRLRLVLGCTGAPSRGCSATVTVRSAAKVRTAPRGRARLLVLAPARRISVRDGARVTVTVTLTRQARALLRAKRKLRVTVTAGTEKATFTVTARRRRR